MTTKHGTAEWYDQGCICGPCTAAAMARDRAGAAERRVDQRREQQRRRRANTLHAARRSGVPVGEWQPWELDLLRDVTLTHGEVAAKVHRSVAAVTSKRYRLGIQSNLPWLERQARLKAYLANPPPVVPATHGAVPPKHRVPGRVVRFVTAAGVQTDAERLLLHRFRSLSPGREGAYWLHLDDVEADTATEWVDWYNATLLPWQVPARIRKY